MNAVECSNRENRVRNMSPCKIKNPIPSLSIYHKPSIFHNMFPELKTFNFIQEWLGMELGTFVMCQISKMHFSHAFPHSWKTLGHKTFLITYSLTAKNSELVIQNGLYVTGIKLYLSFQVSSFNREQATEQEEYFRARNRILRTRYWGSPNPRF